MNLSPTEIESIVRQVVTTYLAGGAITSGASGRSNSASDDGVLILADRVISTNSLQGALAGKKTLRVSEQAIVTPAVKDLCREKGIAIVRGGLQAASPTVSNQEKSVPSDTISVSPVEKTSSRPQRLIVAGTSEHMDAIAKQLCPKQAKVLSVQGDDSSAIRSITDGIIAGHQAAILWVDSPYATCWQAARNDRLRPVVVSQWSDLSNAMREVPLNVLILSRHQWNIPSVCNASRMLFEHLKKSS